MLLLLICVSLLNLIVSPVYGLVTITSQPAKVVNDNFVKLICDVETMKNTAKWVYGGVTYFSCDPPYTNCFTNTNITNNDYYDFSIKGDSLVAIFPVSQNQNDGIWSCYHGNEEDDFEIDNADKAWISSFHTPHPNRNGQYRIRCTLRESQVPVDVLVYAVGYKGTRIIYDVKQSNLSHHSFDTTLLCSESIIYCNATNGYGPTHSKYAAVSVECPLKILYNLSTVTLINDDSNPFREIKIYYEGYPLQARSLYTIGDDGIPEREVGKFYPYVHEQTLIEPAYIYIGYHYNNDYNKYNSRKTFKTGKYMLVLKVEDIAEIVHLNFIDVKPTSAVPNQTSMIVTTNTTYRAPDSNSTNTTAFPTGTSTIDYDPRKTTNRAEDFTTSTPANDMNKMESSKGMFESKGKDETTTMDYLGLAGFVMALFSVLFNVIVGVFWFNRMKKKTTSSEEPIKHPIIFTKT